jgi:hypothetical protein
MGTSKTAKNSKKKNTSGYVHSLKSEITENQKVKPAEEEIRLKAEQIYYGRLDRGEHGNELSDWLQAEALLRESDV